MSVEAITQAAAGLTESEIASLITRFVEQREQIQAQAAQAEAYKREQLTASLPTLDALLGALEGAEADSATILEAVTAAVRTCRDLADVVGA